MWWLFILYAVLLVGVVYLSNTVAKCTDYIEKHTKLTGALLGGIVLAGITSLPELVTGITSSLLGEPSLVQGDIFGSNIFDICILGVIMIVFGRTVKQANVSKDNARLVLWSGLICACIIVVGLIEIFCNVSFVIPYVNINVLAIVCIAVYILALATTQKVDEDIKSDVQSEIDNQNVDVSVNKAELKSVVTKFVVSALLLIGVSIAITFISNIISDEFGLGKGLVGAIFLGVATSLPEIISSFTLVKLGNYNSAYGNIIGSCFFNFLVLGIADMFFFGGTVFMANLKSVYATLCFLVGLGALYLSYFLKARTKHCNQTTLTLCGLTTLVCYVVCLFVLA